MSPKLEMFKKIHVLNYVKYSSYLLKCIPRKFVYKQSFLGPRMLSVNTARLPIILSTAGSTIFKGQKHKQ